MKAQLISKFVDQNSSFAVENHSYKNFLKVWHYHPELELVAIVESTGTRFVGDSIEKFKAGEIVLIGKDLPHLWLNDSAYFDDHSKLNAKAYVLRFHESFAGGMFKIPEMAIIGKLLQRARLGIKFSGSTNEAIIKKISELFALPAYEKVIAFLDILKTLAEQKEYKILSSTGYINSFKEINNNKIVRIYEYIMNHFKEDISLQSVADLAKMNPSAFSRYFKNIQKKTFTQYLNEVRIGYACKLLIEDNYSISGVCFESGFNNISNFNRQFKAIRKMSPSAYMKLHSKV